MRKFFFSMVLAAATLASCSSDSEVKPAGVPEGAEGYVGFSIQLPTTTGTRANDVFDDGDPRPDEYKVHNATLFLFQGTDEASAKFVAVYPMNITNFKADGNDNDQCTTEGIVTSEIVKPGEGQLYAYVLLNGSDLVNINSDKTIQAGNTFNGTPLTNAMTFADFSKMALSKLGNENIGLVMTNTPVCDKQGGVQDATGGTIATLAKLDASKIYATEAKAQADPAGEVYVERAAAKVTVTASMSNDAAIDADAKVKYSKASIKWAINNENKEYYNARQMKSAWLGLAADGEEGPVNASSKYRFVSNGAIHEGVYRTYWAEDMNYSTEPAAAQFKANPTAADITTKAEDGKSVYVTENTFDVQHQSTKNTTGLSVSATFNNGKDFYIASTYGANKILQTPENGTADEKSVTDYIKEYLMNNNAEFKTWAEAGATDFAVTMTNDETAGTATVATVTGTGLPASISKDYINGLIKFKFYKGGVAYYNLLIKHFGQDETPWNRDKHTVNTIEGIYGTEPLATQNFLGRYGVVRNNWYQVEISGISQIGSPIVIDPSTPDNPDDSVNNYLSVKIHILPWAVRKQSEVL